MTRHPFEEFHADADIGCLMWRMLRRGDAMSDSQCGSEIFPMQQAQKEDSAKLSSLIAEYNARAMPCLCSEIDHDYGDYLYEQQRDREIDDD